MGLASLAPDGAHVVSISLDESDKTAKLWAIPAGTLVATLRADLYGFNEVHFAAGGALFVTTAEGDPVVRVWETRTGRRIAQLDNPAYPMQEAVLSPDGTHALTIGPNAIAALWDVKTARVLTPLRGHEFELDSGLFSPDGRLVVALSNDGTAHLWEVSTGRYLARYGEGGLQMVGEMLGGLQGLTVVSTNAAAAFSPDGSRLATTFDGGDATIWDLTGKLRRDHAA